MTAARSLPVVDLARFRVPRADHDEFLARLRGAAHDVGFFVVGHGVPEAVTAGALDAAKAFFALPEAQRLSGRGHRAAGAPARAGVTADPDNPLLPGYGENALVGWLRSHPRVAEKWWADVLARRS